MTGKRLLRLLPALCLAVCLTTVCALAATPLAANIDRRLEHKKAWPWVRLALGAALFLLCLGALASQSYNPFIYFRF